MLTARIDHALAQIGFGGGRLNSRWWGPSLAVAAAGSLYGAAMGAYEPVEPQRLLLIVFGVIKTPLLIVLTTMLCMPGFFMINSVLGLRRDFGEAFRAVTGSQAAFAVSLAAMAPVTLLVYWSKVAHNHAVLFNALMFALATAFAQLVLLRRYRPLVARSRAHRPAMWLWVVLYAFVGTQMGWMMRPFIGTPGKPVTFFREEPFSNAYVVIWKLVAG